MTDDLRAGAVEDRRLAFEDGDEGIPLIADLVEDLAFAGGALFTDRGERSELRR